MKLSRSIMKVIQCLAIALLMINSLTKIWMQLNQLNHPIKACLPEVCDYFKNKLQLLFI